MDRDAPLPALPLTYRHALDLVAQGASNDEIARQLGVPAEAVPALVALAEAKLHRVVSLRSSAGRDHMSAPGLMTTTPRRGPRGPVSGCSSDRERDDCVGPNVAVAGEP